MSQDYWISAEMDGQRLKAKALYSRARSVQLAYARIASDRIRPFIFTQLTLLDGEVLVICS